MEINEEMREWIDRTAGGMTLEQDEYIDPADDLIHCSVCHERRQTIVKRFHRPGYFLPCCLCLCQQQKEQQIQEQRKQQERMERIKRRKAYGLRDACLQNFTFENDHGRNSVMQKAREYVSGWREAYQKCVGLLLFGGVGTGKSFFAGCIANALLDQDIPVFMTSFPTLLNRLSSVYPEERTELIRSLNDFDLLIIDDLGVEHSTEFVMEQMFEIIDTRYRSQKPLIVTTNLSLDDLRNPPDIAHARIYSRILERCAPILFSGENYRIQKQKQNKDYARKTVWAENRSGLQTRE